ncbi:MAG: diguanylate cyclase [bacterium]
MERLLKNEKKFLNIHTNIVVAILIYLIYKQISATVNDIEWTIIGFIISSHLINYIFYKLEFLQKYEVFYLIKYIQIIVAAFASFEQMFFIGSMASITYILLFIEVIVVSGAKISSSSKFFQYLLRILCIIPILIAYFAADYANKFPNSEIYDALFFIIYFTLILMGLLIIISDNAKELHHKIETQRNLFNEAKQINQELKITQQKYISAHDQLTKQNSDLEDAYKKLNRASSEMYIQNELLKYISSALEIEELMDMVTDSIIGAIGVDTCSIIIYDPNRDNYKAKFKSTYNKDYSKSLMKYITSGKLDSYFNSSKPYTDNNVNIEDYPFLDDRDVGSLIIIPLIRNQLTYGLLIAEQKTENTFTDNNIQFFDGIATQINIAINNANLYAKMEDMAIRDGLTGVYNRSYLQHRFSELVKEAVMNKTSLSVALFDIDKFKRVNDTYGHLFGDEAIKMAARVTEKIASLNKGLVGRFGGEEFVIILPNKSTEEAYQISKEVHEKIKTTSLDYNGEKIYINVSIGVTTYPETCKNPSELLNRADLAMYYSKQNGRGRITIDNENLESMVNM